MRSGLLKIISMTGILAVLSSAFFMPGTVQAKEVADKGDFKFVISDETNTAEIVSYVGQSLYVSIPTEIEKCKVTSIGTAAFKNNTTIKELEIPDTITNIDIAAFSGCSSLHKVHITGNVKTIGKSAFSGCVKLKELSIDDGLERIEKYAFSECSSLRTVVLPNSVDYVGDYAFINCTELDNPQMPKTMRYFGGYALENTKWMKSRKGDFVTIGDGVLIKYIGKSDIKSLPKKIKTIGSYAFAGNNNIKNIIIPSTVSVIQNSAFEGCEKLEDVYMPRSIERIGERVFYGCKALSTIELTDRMTLIDSYCFAHSGLTEISIPKNVSVINEGAFDGCKSLVNVHFGAGLKKISTYAFRNCDSLKRVVLPKNVQEVEKDAFAGCKKLLRAEFNGDTKLNEAAFDECPNMREAVFYQNPKTIEDNAFAQVPDLVIYSDNNMYLDEYAERNSKLSENIKNLPQFNEMMATDKSLENNNNFSIGYTIITILIILIDISLIGLFAFYILIIDKRKMIAEEKRDLKLRAAENRNERVRSGNPAPENDNTRRPVKRKHPAKISSDDDLTYIHAPKKKPQRPVQRPAQSSNSQRPKRQRLDDPIPERIRPTGSENRPKRQPVNKNDTMEFRRPKNKNE